MTKMMVPHGRSNNSKSVGNSSKDDHSAERWSERPEKTHRVQWTSAIRPDDQVLDCKILHEQTKWVKLIIIGIHQAVALGLINPLPLPEAGNIISILVFTSPM
jgi:hypothetical protein